MRKIILSVGLLAFLFSVTSAFAVPQFQNVVFSYANNSVYQSPSTNFGFQTNVTDPQCTGNETTCIQHVRIELNYSGSLTNYTMANASANRIYTLNVTGGIKATNVSVRFYANNSTGGIDSANANSSTAVIYFQTVNTTPYLDIYANDQSYANLSITFGTTTNVSGINRGGMRLGAATFNRDGVSATSENNTNTTLGVSTGGNNPSNAHNYTFTTASNENFTANSTGLTIFITVGAVVAGGSGGGGGYTPPQAPAVSYSPPPSPTISTSQQTPNVDPTTIVGILAVIAIGYLFLHKKH